MLNLCIENKKSEAVEVNLQVSRKASKICGCLTGKIVNDLSNACLHYVKLCLVSVLLMERDGRQDDLYHLSLFIA